MTRAERRRLGRELKRLHGLASDLKAQIEEASMQADGRLRLLICTAKDDAADAERMLKESVLEARKE